MGTPGLTADGELPDNIAYQARQAWQNVEAALVIICEDNDGWRWEPA